MNTPRLPTPTSGIHCPCCGGGVDPCRVLVDLSSNTVTYGGQSICVSPTEAEIIHILATAYPHGVMVKELFFAIWGNHEPNCAWVSLRVHVSRCRRILKNIGLSIPRASHRPHELGGYKLEVRAATNGQYKSLPEISQADPPFACPPDRTGKVAR